MYKMVTPEQYNVLRENELALVKHIEAMNKDADKKMAETKGLWIGHLVTDPMHWASYDVYTPKQFDRYMLETDHYYIMADRYSKSYARSIDLTNWTDAEIMADIDNESEVA